MGPLPPVSPLPSCQNVSFGGTGEVLENYEITTVDELLKLRQKITDSKATERPLWAISNSGRLGSVKNGKEVAQSLNVPYGGDVVFK
jgi:hypothetical protein